MDLEFLLDLGYIGLFIGTFIAATVVPFSSDFLIIGILIAGGDPLVSWICATAGNWLGGLTSYWIGRIGKWEWIEKWFHVKEETLLKQKSKIDKYGSLLAFLTWLPFVGDHRKGHPFRFLAGPLLHFRRQPADVLKKCVTLHPVLTYGVMVALQILVLSVEVRILLGQQHNDKIFSFFDNYTPVHQRV